MAIEGNSWGGAPTGNANQLAEDLDLDYKTVQHHLRVLQENNVLEDSGNDYGAVYLPTQQTQVNWDIIEEISEEVH